MRREARSTANHSQTLRLRWPTKVHSSSSSKASGLRRWAFFVRRRGSRDEASAAFFYQLRDRHPRRARRAHDAALGVALGEQGLDLGILRRFGHGRGHEPRLVAARLTLVLGLAALRSVAADVFAAAAGT